MNAEIEEIGKELHEAEEAARAAAIRVEKLLIKMRDAYLRHTAAQTPVPQPVASSPAVRSDLPEKGGTNAVGK